MAQTTSFDPADRRLVSPDKKIGLENIAETSAWSSSLESKFGDLIPKNLSENEKERALTGIGVAVFVKGLDAGAIGRDLEQAREALIRQRGPEIAPKADRMAVLGYARQNKAEAIERDPLNALEPAQKAAYVSAAKYARSNLGWTTQQIREASVELIVRNQGDISKAADAFIASAKEIGPEIKPGRGTSLDQATEGEKKLEIAAPVQMSPEERADYERKNDQFTLAGLARTDRIAAAVLSNQEYAGYRIMRENAVTLYARDDGKKLDGAALDNTPGKLVAETLKISERAGRDVAHGVVEKLRGNVESIKPVSAQIVDERLGKSTQDLIASSIENAKRTMLAPEEFEARRERERAMTRERAARLYAMKKERARPELAIANPEIAADSVKKYRSANRSTPSRESGIER